MNYTDAVTIVQAAYGSQADLILKKLCEESIITLAKLSGQNILRQMTDATIHRLSAMEPHRQSGFIANPLLAFVMDNCTRQILEKKPIATKSGKNNLKPNIKPDPKPVPTPEPEPDEPEEDEEPEPNIFDMF